jgi:hypothetical protein
MQNKLDFNLQGFWSITLSGRLFQKLLISFFLKGDHCLYSQQYSETSVMNILFSLLRITSLYMFRALLVHPQEVLHKRHLVYCMRVMSVGCTRKLT